MSDVGQIPPPYNPNDVYNLAFRHVRPPYPNLARQSGGDIGISPVGTVRALKGSFNLTSIMNTPFTMPTKLDGWQMPNEPTIEIRGGKNIIETQLNRGDRVQNVLEEINLNNYEIRLRGVIINESEFDLYPEEDVRRLREICEKPGAVSITNGILNLFNINQVAIRDVELFEVRGYAGAQAYELVLLSDEDFELEIIEAPERL